MLTDHTPEPYHLSAALLVYQASDPRNAVVVEHDIHAREGKPLLGSGRFVTADFVRRLLDVVDLAPLTYVPDNVIAVGHDAIAWFEPASTIRLLFATNDPAVNAFDNVELPQPPLVFMARKRSLFVYALASNERPTAQTALWKAPYFNVFADHRVCIGSMRIPERVDVDAAPAWTHAFFASNFTHLSDSVARWNHDGTYAELLQATRRRGHFDPQWLKPTSLTLHSALSTGSGQTS